MKNVAELLESRLSELSPESQDLLKKLIRKLKSFSTTPLNRKHCLRMEPFSKSMEITKLIIDVIRPYELKLIGETCFSAYDSIGYHYCIALLACRTVYNDKDELDVLTMLEHEVEKEIKKNELVAARGGENYHVMLRTFKCFKNDTDRLNGLIMHLQNDKS